jgi:class 3 adenylate cyclase
MDGDLPEPIEPLSEEAIARLIPRHAPRGWEERFDRQGHLATLIREGRQFQLLVLAADIRHSTVLQKEATSVLFHALILTRFVEAAADTIRVVHEGWFDKFTGDGFLAYWVLRLVDPPGSEAPLPVVLRNDDHPAWEQVISAFNFANRVAWVLCRSGDWGL